MLSNPSELGPALAEAILHPNQFKDVQRQLFASSIALEATPSSVRAARAILNYLESSDGTTATFPAFAGSATMPIDDAA